MPRIALELPIWVSVVEVDGVHDESTGLAAEALDRCAQRYCDEFAAKGVTAPGSVPGVGVARELFHALSIDPTRYRPCSEALLNRALKCKPQPHVCALVDVGNWCALDFQLPLGIYDADAIEGDVVLRQGRAGETYTALNGRDITLEGRYVLADAVGPFGSPITDSQRTAVSAETTGTAAVMYAPRSYDRDRFRDETRELSRRVIEYCGGTLVKEEVVLG